MVGVTCSSALPVKRLRKDSLSTVSDSENAVETCKGCGNTFPKCTECKNVLAVNVSEGEGREA